MADESRIERILTMILLNDLEAAPQAKKAEILNRIGYSNSEIAELLGTTAATVGQQLYSLRGAKKAAGRRPNTRKAAGQKRQ
jgi:predicted transcriptional regulator